MERKERAEAADEILNELLQRTDRMEAGEIPINIQRVDQLRFAYAGAQKYASGINVDVRMCENMPFVGMGSVQIEGKTIAFTNTEWFARIAEFANNTEIYPLTNGNVRVTFTFYGLTKKNA
ncbi:MAG: hypothetical protein E7467_00335 [Ruminococcaceae bacterium]|nr:hypothetical protein [Oscillospiraceae bacterium]